MPIHINDTVANQIQVLDDGTSLADIMTALGWFKKEKTRQHNKHKRLYKPTGNPVGRPKKQRPVEDSVPSEAPTTPN
jgi:hypothetical protein